MLNCTSNPHLKVSTSTGPVLPVDHQQQLRRWTSQFYGEVDFHVAFQIQEDCWQKAKDEGLDTILGFEHPTIVTLGRRAELNQVYSSSLPTVSIQRGGLATLHSPGQLVIYPIVHLQERHIGVKDFVCSLLKATQAVFKDYGVETFLDPDKVGLYTDMGKIAFCGLQIKNGICLHGISINLSNDLSLFKNIQSCGVTNRPLDRLENHLCGVTTAAFFQKWVLQYVVVHGNLAPCT